MRGSTRRVLWGVLFAALILGGVNARVVRLLVHPREASPPPDRASPELPLFLQEVAARTAPGDTILLVAPEYEYPFYRASYLLAERRIIPWLDESGRAHPERLHAARFIAAWRAPAPAGFQQVWAGHEGVLLRSGR